MWVVLADLNNVTHKHLHGHPEAWKGALKMKSQLQGALSASLSMVSPLVLSPEEIVEAETSSYRCSDPALGEAGSWDAKSSGVRHL